MKKVLVLVLGALALWVGLAAAANTDAFTITVTVKWMDVTLKLSEAHGTDYTNWAVGAVDAGVMQTMPSSAIGHIWANNGSNIPINLQASVASVAPGACGFGVPTAWTAAGAAGTDIYKLEVATGTATTPTGTWTTVLAAPTTYTASTVAIAGGQDFFYRLTPPTATTDGCQHTLTVTIYAIQ